MVKILLAFSKFHSGNGTMSFTQLVEPVCGRRKLKWHLPAKENKKKTNQNCTVFYFLGCEYGNFHNWLLAADATLSENGWFKMEVQIQYISGKLSLSCTQVPFHDRKNIFTSTTNPPVPLLCWNTLRDYNIDKEKDWGWGWNITRGDRWIHAWNELKTSLFGKCLN